MATQSKEFLTDCADVLLAITDGKGAQRLFAASTYWLRHNHGSHSVGAGTVLEVLRQNLGRASLNTITIYVTTSRRIGMDA